MSYESYPGMPKDCLLCGKQNPPGHVVVFSRQQKAVGQVCSSHTLVEVILNPIIQFDVKLIHDGPREGSM